MTQKLSATARRDKAARDLAYAKTDSRRIKKAEIPLEITLIPQGSFEILLSMEPNELIKCKPGYEDCNPEEAMNVNELTFWNESFNKELI